MILGISGSGRKNGTTSDVIKYILENSGEEYEYISLAGKQINGCIGCTECAGDSFCKVKDDWQEIGYKMLEADAIVFGAPDYFDTLNALAHACLERTYCFRHREKVKLAGKLAVAVAVDGDPEVSRVLTYIKRLMSSNQMAIMDTLHVEGDSQCFTCGYGEDCAAGTVVKRHGFLDEIKAEHLPDKFSDQPDKMLEAKMIARNLGSIITDRRGNNEDIKED